MLLHAMYKHVQAERRCTVERNLKSEKQNKIRDICFYNIVLKNKMWFGFQHRRSPTGGLGGAVKGKLERALKTQSSTSPSGD